MASKSKSKVVIPYLVGGYEPALVRARITYGCIVGALRIPGGSAPGLTGIEPVIVGRIINSTYRICNLRFKINVRGQVMARIHGNRRRQVEFCGMVGKSIK